MVKGDKKTFKTSGSPREKLQKRYFPNFELTTHDGRKVHFYDDLIKDKIVVIMGGKPDGIDAAAWGKATNPQARAMNIFGRGFGNHDQDIVLRLLRT